MTKEYISPERVEKAVKSVSVIDYFEYLRRKGVVRLLDEKLHGVARRDLYYVTDSNKYSVSENGYYDFKSDEKGQIINAVMSFENLDWYNTILFLEKFSGLDLNQSIKQPKEYSNIIQEKRKDTPASNREITYVGKPNNETLLDYFRGRGIPDSITQRYLYQVHYNVKTDDGKGNISTHVRFGFGLKNAVGGYALRSNMMKTYLGPSSYSLVKNSNTANKVVLFEGMTDMLSYVVLSKEKGININNTDFVCLNSVVNAGRFAKDYEEGKTPTYERICLLLNGDEAGQKATNLLQEAFKEKEVRVTDCRDVFDIGKQYNDLNDFLLKKRSVAVNMQNIDEEHQELVRRCFKELKAVVSDDEYIAFTELFNSLTEPKTQTLGYKIL